MYFSHHQECPDDPSGRTWEKKYSSSDKIVKQSDHPSIRTFLAVDLIRRASVQFVLTHNPSLYK